MPARPRKKPSQKPVEVGKNSLPEELKKRRAVPVDISIKRELGYFNKGAKLLLFLKQPAGLTSIWLG